MYKKNTKFTRNHISRPFLSRVCRFRLPYLIEIFFISSTFLVGACRFLIIYCWNNDSHLVLIFILLKKFNNSHLIVSCGPAWNSVVGKDFGSCITHLCGSFIFFRVEMMEFLIFKDGKNFTESREEAIGVLQKARNCD